MPIPTSFRLECHALYMRHFLQRVSKLDGFNRLAMSLAMRDANADVVMVDEVGQGGNGIPDRVASGILISVSRYW